MGEGGGGGGKGGDAGVHEVSRGRNSRSFGPGGWRFRRKRQFSSFWTDPVICFQTRGNPAEASCLKTRSVLCLPAARPRALGRFVRVLPSNSAVSLCASERCGQTHHG